MSNPTFYSNTSPKQDDTLHMVLQKCLGKLNDILTAAGLPMSAPAFFSEGSTNRRDDSCWKIAQKILGGLNTLAATPYAAGGNYHGNGDPNGVVTASKGAIYTQDDAPGTIWVKTTDASATGWV